MICGQVWRRGGSAAPSPPASLLNRPAQRRDNTFGPCRRPDLIRRTGHTHLKTTLITLLSFLILVPPAVASDNIRVGAWNIETLGTPQNRDYRRKRKSHGFGVARDPGELASEIRKLTLDMLVVTEIDDTAQQEARRGNQILDHTLVILNQTAGYDWTYVLFPKYGYYAHSQLTGVAWNRKRISQRGDWYRVELGERTSRFWEWDRHPHAIAFSRGAGRTDFVVIPIHMKAGRSGKAIDQRRVEAHALVATLEDIKAHFNDDDLILIGDFNMTHAHEGAGSVYRDAGLVDLNAKDAPTHAAGLALDRVYVPSNPLFEGLSQFSVASPANTKTAGFRRRLSDHWPIVLEFEDKPDDD